MAGLMQDVRYAARALRRAPGFVAVAVTTLALGIAAATLVYTLVDGVLLRPLPFHDSDRIVLARETRHGGRAMSLAWPNFVDLRTRATSFQTIGGWVGGPVNLTGVDQPELLAGRRVTANLFDVLGVHPAIGRTFTTADDQPGADPVVIISHRLWQRRFGGDPAVIGQRLRLDEVQATIVGVLPPSFSIDHPDDVFEPIGQLLIPGSYRLARQNHWGLSAVARLRPGVSVEAARAEVETIAAQLASEYPDSNSGNGATLVRLHESIAGDVRPMLLVLLASVAALLLIGCANLANLLLARAAGRGQEIAIRSALGAGRSRVVRQLLTESMLLSTAGGAAGMALAWASLRTILAVLPSTFPRVHLVELNGRVLLAAALASTATGVLFGLVPALHAAGSGGGTLLRGSRASTAGTGSRTRRLLLVGEIATALVLVSGAGLMVRTMARLLAVDPGVRTTDVLTARFQLTGERYEDEDSRRAFYARAEEAVRAVPGVLDVGFTLTLPTEGANWSSAFVIDGQPEPPRAQVPSLPMNPVSAGFFRTMGIPLVEGREVGPGDAPEHPLVAVVNQAFARRFFPGESPIGHRFKQGWTLAGSAPWIEIVGVAGDVKVSGLDQPASIQAYLALGQYPNNQVAIAVRTTGDPAGAASAVEAALHEVEPNLPIFSVRPMTAVIAEGIGAERLTLLLLGGFAMIALVLAAVGVFGVTAFIVSQRTHEFGLRMALGADRGAILRLVLSEGARVAVAGVVLGLAGAVTLAGLMRSLVFEVAPRDPATLSVTSVLLLVVALAACYLPARRAVRVDPASALRTP